MFGSQNYWGLWWLPIMKVFLAPKQLFYSQNIFLLDSFQLFCLYFVRVHGDPETRFIYHWNVKIWRRECRRLGSKEAANTMSLHVATNLKETPKNSPVQWPLMKFYFMGQWLFISSSFWRLGPDLGSLPCWMKLASENPVLYSYVLFPLTNERVISVSDTVASFLPEVTCTWI
jgi:hypothetical protein